MVTTGRNGAQPVGADAVALFGQRPFIKKLSRIFRPDGHDLLRVNA
jgi:hypothetical protein